jgi:pimeloyl-ACP methyl ester carboxylesterase
MNIQNRIAFILFLFVFAMGKFVNKNPHLNKRDGLEWHSCGVNLKCSSIFVPLDHQDPNSELISLQLTKYLAKVQPALKTVLVNPGGPGVEGNRWVENDGRRLSLIFAGKVDIVAFNPRGTGNSSPNCPLPHIFSGYRAALEKFNAAHLPLNSNVKMIRYFDRAHQLGSDICASTNEKILSFVSTPNTARDMDLIRRALGMDKLNYYGISYGTVLGLTYANMFPDTVGRMILDGIVNPKDHYGDNFK